MKKNTKITYNLIILAIFIPAFLLVLFLTGIFPIANTAGNRLQQQLYKIVASGTIVQATFTISAICIFALSIIIRIATLKGSYKGVYLKDAKDVIEPIYAERIIDSITNPTNLILAEIVDLIKRGFLAINELGNIDILNSNSTSFDDTADYYFVNSILKIPGMKRFQNKGITSVTLNNVITGVALNSEDAREFHEFDDYIEGKIYEKKLIKMIPTYIVYAIRIITFALAMGSICLFMVNFTGKIGFLAALIFIIISAFGLSETLEVQKKMIMFGYDLHKYKTVSRRMNIITALLLIVLFIAAFLTFAFYKTNGLVSIRYPKGEEDTIVSNFDDSYCDYRVIGKSDIVIVTYGRLVGQAIRAKKRLLDSGINVAVMKLGKICPIEKEVLYELMKFRKIFFFEEGIKRGGIGEHVISDLVELGFDGKWSLTAIDNSFVPQSRIYSALESLGLDYKSMIEKIISDRVNICDCKASVVNERG